MRGAAKLAACTTCRNSSSIGSMRGEWKAWLTRSRFDFSNRPAMASTSSSSPEMTTEVGPFRAAMDTLSVSSGRISSSVACTATIAPPSGSACISRPRAATRAAASSSDHTPATCAAASSPIEWPSR